MEFWFFYLNDLCYIENRGCMIYKELFFFIVYLFLYCFVVVVFYVLFFVLKREIEVFSGRISGISFLLINMFFWIEKELGWYFGVFLLGWVDCYLWFCLWMKFLFWEIEFWAGDFFFGFFSDLLFGVYLVV